MYVCTNYLAHNVIIIWHHTGLHIYVICKLPCTQCDNCLTQYSAAYLYVQMFLHTMWWISDIKQCYIFVRANHLSHNVVNIWQYTVLHICMCLLSCTWCDKYMKTHSASVCAYYLTCNVINIWHQIELHLCIC